MHVAACPGGSRAGTNACPPGPSFSANKFSHTLFNIDHPIVSLSHINYTLSLIMAFSRLTSFIYSKPATPTAQKPQCKYFRAISTLDVALTGDIKPMMTMNGQTAHPVKLMVRTRLETTLPTTIPEPIA
jgi:hypothetical protein